ncbi:putative ATP-dependent DNA ligase YkoU [Variibacter gotjawalensis]|uniref:DNA ligase (ATP) n=1 Tax=Variibacter gotjawalensis TaxID=1333996 RepID=A0A0S3PPB7_9BRAD|nr:DNA ligase D [Variibacter gotjawalensis]NIK47907.1 bifunctional non-homologous end joining protein LigD [Variibacter gotjawalensis]RZS49785.1 ATP-dependent DNA ligase LigD phosphoesterase module /ATP-dependent DNA ligase LigD polymerase module [Variibacter gotjawalensis]BAT57614.1 putative ATP-dependent DNA ligase YkoU [Variibacter gotjawalensis]
MALDTYRKKRDFSKTAEPRGKKKMPKKTGNSFVVQKHAARRLHYDFRLEMDGVLKSWAVARGPSLVPGEKRLAVETEDHPLEYGDFEGTIPKGEYGGGSVIVWDRGTWTPEFDADFGYKKGHLEFELEGEKLSGKWHLVRMARRRGEKRDNWLLIKVEDDAARTASDPDILEESPESVKTGRVVEDLDGEAPGWSSKTGKIDRKEPAKKAKTSKKKSAKATAEAPGTQAVAPQAVDPSQIKGAKKAALPNVIPPALASLAEKPPSGDRWVHEIKFDGYRLMVRIEAGRVKLLTRTGLDWTKRFGKELVAAFQDLPIGKAMLDGEVVVERDNGASDFSALQADLSEGRGDRFIYYAFDLPYIDGYDLTGANLLDRKAALSQLVGDGSGTIRYSAHFEADGPTVLEHASRLGLEGIVSKASDAPYREGRSKSWLKSKGSLRQEFVIGGYVPSSTSRKAIGALSLGVYEDGKLRHVGRVGTGFSHKVSEQLFTRLERLRGDSPFAGRLDAVAARGVRYVRPELVADVEFRAWTADGNIRHASFRGLREDKDADDIVLETGMPKAAKTAKAKSTPDVTLTHPDRVYWPDEGVTKQGLADYYAEVWDHMAPFIVGRPLALLRSPDGITGKGFFQKHAWKGLNKSIDLVPDPKEKGEEPLIAIHDLTGLTALVQAAVLEIHPWGSTVKDWEHPDTLILDLDPGDGVSWQEMIAAAHEAKERLEAVGLAAFVKTSGGKGLHVVSPLKPKGAWPDLKEFTKAMADAMASDSPNKYVSTIAKAKRGGKILIDYLRNQRGQTAVAAYSTRARPGAAVSMPLAWDELSSVGPAYFTIVNAPQRLAALKRDPWATFRKSEAPLAIKTSAKKVRK